VEELEYAVIRSVTTSTAQGRKIRRAGDYKNLSIFMEFVYVHLRTGDKLTREVFVFLAFTFTPELFAVVSFP